MKSEAFLLRIMAVNVSVALHALLLFQFGGSAVSTTPVKQAISQRMITRITLIAPTELSSVAIPKSVTPKSEPVPPKPRPVHQRQPKPLKSRPAATLPHRIPSHKPIQDVEREAKKPTQAKINQAASAPKLVQQVAVDNGFINQLRQQYLAAVMAHVEQHKYYPSTARRRGVQGDVGIRFILLNNGAIRDVKVDGSAAILRKAAKRAVIKALPMPKPPRALHDPILCEFSMRYALK